MQEIRNIVTAYRMCKLYHIVEQNSTGAVVPRLWQRAGEGCGGGHKWTLQDSPGDHV